MTLYDAIEYLASTTGYVEFKNEMLLVADSSESIEARYDDNFTILVAALTGQKSSKIIIPEFQKFKNGGAIGFFSVPGNRPVSGTKWICAATRGNAITFRYRGFDDFRTKISNL